MEIKDRFVVLFYLLMKDKMPIGEVNELVATCIGTADLPITAEDGRLLFFNYSFFCDNLLRKKAESLARQMVSGEYLVGEE